MLSLTRLIPAPFRRFATEEHAAISVEAAIMLPILCAMYVGGYQFFDQYRREGQMQKAAYAVADMLTRKRVSVVTPNDLNGLERIYETLTNSQDLSYMRFTEIQRRNDRLEVVWSYATDGQPALNNERLQAFYNQIPTMTNSERLTLVEAYTYDAPFFDVGLGDRIIPVFLPTTQRYFPRLVFAPNGQVDPSNGSVTINNTDCLNGQEVVDGVLIGTTGNCQGV